MVMPQLESCGRAGTEAAEHLAHVLPDRFQRLDPRRLFRRVDSHAFRRAVIDGHEDRHLALLDRLGVSGSDPACQSGP